MAPQCHEHNSIQQYHAHCWVGYVRVALFLPNLLPLSVMTLNTAVGLAPPLYIQCWLAQWNLRGT